jgi:hypothetical protein
MVIDKSEQLQYEGRQAGLFVQYDPCLCRRIFESLIPILRGENNETK